MTGRGMREKGSRLQRCGFSCPDACPSYMVRHRANHRVMTPDSVRGRSGRSRIPRLSTRQTGGTYAVTASSGSTTRKRSRPLWRMFEPPTSGLTRPESPRPRACSGTLRRHLHSHRSSPARHGWWNWGSSVKPARPQPTGMVCAFTAAACSMGARTAPALRLSEGLRRQRVHLGREPSPRSWRGRRAICAAVYDERTFVLDCQRNLAPEAIDPSTVALFSAAQYREPGFAFQPFTEETRVTWTWGYSLLRRAPVLVPAALVYRPYWPIEDEAAIGDFPTTGLACGNSLADAILRGLYETVERDAIMITWLNRLPACRVRLDRLAPAIDADSPWAQLAGRGLFAHDITTDVAIPTRLAVFIDRSGPRVFVTVGAAAHDHADRALEKAVAEALALRPAVEHVVDPRRALTPSGRWKIT